MKVFELIEAADWEDIALVTRKTEQESLISKREAISHELELIWKAFERFQNDGIVFDKTQLARSPVSSGDFMPLNLPTVVPSIGSKQLFVKRGSPLPPEVAKLAKEIEALHNQYHDVQEKLKDLNIRGKTFCFTGFRDKELENKIIAQRGQVLSSASGRMDYLVAKDPNSGSGKIQKAHQMGARIISREQLVHMLRD